MVTDRINIWVRCLLVWPNVCPKKRHGVWLNKFTRVWKGSALSNPNDWILLYIKTLLFNIRMRDEKDGSVK